MEKVDVALKVGEGNFRLVAETTVVVAFYLHHAVDEITLASIPSIINIF